MEGKVQIDIFGNKIEIPEEFEEIKTIEPIKEVVFKESVKDKELQLSILDCLPESWEKEWQGMPEFIQKDEKPIQQIIVSFLRKEDVKIFSELIGQKCTYQTKSLWFPKLENEKPSDYIYES